MPSYQHRKSHCGDKTILRPSYLHNGISYTGKTASLYWIRALWFIQGYFTCTGTSVWLTPCRWSDSEKDIRTFAKLLYYVHCVGDEHTRALLVQSGDRVQGSMIITAAVICHYSSGYPRFAKQRHNSICPTVISMGHIAGMTRITISPAAHPRPPLLEWGPGN